MHQGNMKGKTAPYRKALKCLLMLIALVWCTAGCGGENIKQQPSEEERVEKILQSMSQTEKLGQMMMIGIGGINADADALYQLHQFHFGGVILFDRNMESFEQVKRLTEDLQCRSEEKLPLFIAVDEEGGDVARMTHALPAPPSQQEIGAGDKPELAAQYAAETARNLQKLGINVNFAPVADIGDGGNRGNRHYSEDPVKTAAFVEAAARGYEKEKMYYALKHFPGIGKGKSDAHFDKVVINSDKKELLAEDIVPFRQVMEKHQTGNYFVMISHNLYPSLAGEKPASMSREIMTDLLRGELGYQGVIITDDMEMGATAKYNSFRESGVKAVEAGADIVLVCHEYEHETEVYMGMLDALREGRLKEERVNDSVRRIIRMKLRYLSNNKI